MWIEWCKSYIFHILIFSSGLCTGQIPQRAFKLSTMSASISRAGDITPPTNAPLGKDSKHCRIYGSNYSRLKPCKPGAGCESPDWRRGLDIFVRCQGCWHVSMGNGELGHRYSTFRSYTVYTWPSSGIYMTMMNCLIWWHRKIKSMHTQHLQVLSKWSELVICRIRIPFQNFRISEWNMVLTHWIFEDTSCSCSVLGV